jgi:hypothetical protein
MNIEIACFVILSLIVTSCHRRVITKTTRIIHRRQLTSEWHKQEEEKIDEAVNQLRANGMWNEHWDKFSKLATYEWRSNMDCGDATRSVPCMSGGYNFSQEAFEKLKRGDLSHNPRNTPEESAQSFQSLIHSRQ